MILLGYFLIGLLCAIVWKKLKLDEGLMGGPPPSIVFVFWFFIVPITILGFIACLFDDWLNKNIK